MPLFTKEPVRLHNPGGTVASTSRLLFDDADESEWMFVATSRQVRSFTDRLQRKLRIFDSMTKYERRHVRLQVRNGSDLSLQLYRSDSIHDADCVAYYDLNALQNVKNVYLEKEDALPYMTFVDDSGARDASVGIAVTELVYGQVGIRLELEESVSDGVDRRRNDDGSGGTASVGARVAAHFEAPLDAMANVVRGTLNDLDGGGGGDAQNGGTAGGGGGSRLGAAGKVSKRLQKKLERKGKATSVHLVLPTVDARDAWGHWFKTLMRHIELQRIAEMEVDPITGEHIELIDADMIHRMAEARNTTVSSNSFRSAVKDLTNQFMNMNMRGADAIGGISTDAPNKGRVQVRAPGADAFVHVQLTAWMQAGEIVLTPYQPKESISKSLLSLQQLLGSGGDGELVVRSSNASGPVRKLRLSDQTLIRAPTPWSCEFQLIMMQPTSGAESGGGPNGESAPTSVSWYFIAPNTDARRAFVEWLRLVKGRGTKSQTDADTYPYQTALEGYDGDDTLGEDDADGGRRRRVGLSEQIHASLGVSKAAAAAAAFVVRQQSGLVGTSPSDAESPPPADDDAASDTTDAHREDIGAEVMNDRNASRQNEPASAVQPQKPTSASQEALDVEQRLFADLQEPLASPRSDDSVHSIRRFTYFPRHAETITEAYLTDVCAVHLLGRNERAGGRSGRQDKKKPIHWAYLVQRAAQDGGGRRWGDEGGEGGAAEGGEVDGAPAPRGRRSSILVEQLLLSPSARRAEKRTDRNASPAPRGDVATRTPTASASPRSRGDASLVAPKATVRLLKDHYLGARAPNSAAASVASSGPGSQRAMLPHDRRHSHQGNGRLRQTTTTAVNDTPQRPRARTPTTSATPSSRALLQPGAFSALHACRHVPPGRTDSSVKHRHP